MARALKIGNRVKPPKAGAGLNPKKLNRSRSPFSNPERGPRHQVWITPEQQDAARKPRRMTCPVCGCRMSVGAYNRHRGGCQ